MTFLIGLLPTTPRSGCGAPVLLTALRFLQGFAVGGEWGGATLMVVEHAGPKSRGFYGSWPQMGIPAALLLSSGVMAAVTGLTSTEEFAAWGWRVCRSSSAASCSSSDRHPPPPRRVAELSAPEADGRARILPIGTVLSRRKRLTALLIGSQAAENTSFYVFAVYSLAYLTTALGVPRPVVLNALMVAAAACLVAQPLFGALSDRIGRKRVFAGGMVFIGLFIVPFFLLIASRDPVLITVAMVARPRLRAGDDQAVQPSLFAEQYEAAIRYSGVSVAYQFATVLWSGPTPILAAALWAWSGSWWPLAGYIVGAAVVSVLCIRPLREAAGRRARRGDRRGREGSATAALRGQWREVPGWGGHCHTPIVEMVDRSFDMLRFFPLATEADIAANLAWMAPHHFDPETRRLLLSMHSWLVEVGGRRILVDGCVGNGKQRDARPTGATCRPRSSTGWRRRAPPRRRSTSSCAPISTPTMSAGTRGSSTGAGCRPSRTRPTSSAAASMPTGRPSTRGARVARISRPIATACFPSSKPAARSDRRRASRARGRAPPRARARAHAGSRRGLAPLRAETAAFTGDVLHHPVQVLNPDWNCMGCLDPAMAARTRRRVLAEVARTRASCSRAIS